MTENNQYTFENPHRYSTFFIPSSVFLPISIVMSHLKRKYKDHPDIKFASAQGCLDSIRLGKTRNLQTGQYPVLALAPGLRAKPWWHAEDDPEIERIQKALANASDTIRKEYQEAEKKAEITHRYRAARRYGETAENAWKGYQISNIMGLRENAKQRFPETSRVIESLGFRVLAADFLSMEAGSRLPIHTDGTNLIIACHLGINGAEHCALSVMAKHEDIYPGKIVFFDQSFPHTAWNHGNRQRVVLLLSLIHPDISEKEFMIVKEFIRKTRRLSYLFAPIIALEYLIRRPFQKINSGN